MIPFLPPSFLRQAVVSLIRARVFRCCRGRGTTYRSSVPAKPLRSSKHSCRCRIPDFGRALGVTHDRNPPSRSGAALLVTTCGNDARSSSTKRPVGGGASARSAGQASARRDPEAGRRGGALERALILKSDGVPLAEFIGFVTAYRAASEFQISTLLWFLFVSGRHGRAAGSTPGRSVARHSIRCGSSMMRT